MSVFLCCPTSVLFIVILFSLLVFTCVQGGRSGEAAAADETGAQRGETSPSFAESKTSGDWVSLRAASRVIHGSLSTQLFAHRKNSRSAVYVAILLLP